MNKNTIALLRTTKEDDTEVNAERTKDICMSNKNKAGQKDKIKTANKSFDKVGVTGLRTTL
jgi:hypothetical protein